MSSDPTAQQIFLGCASGELAVVQLDVEPAVLTVLQAHQGPILAIASCRGDSSEAVIASVSSSAILIHFLPSDTEEVKLVPMYTVSPPGGRLAVPYSSEHPEHPKHPRLDLKPQFHPL